MNKKEITEELFDHLIMAFFSAILMVLVFSLSCTVRDVAVESTPEPQETDTIQNIIDIKAVIDYHMKRSGRASDNSRAYQGIHDCESDKLSCEVYKDYF